MSEAFTLARRSRFCGIRAQMHQAPESGRGAHKKSGRASRPAAEVSYRGFLHWQPTPDRYAEGKPSTVTVTAMERATERTNLRRPPVPECISNMELRSLAWGPVPLRIAKDTWRDQ